MIKMTPDIFDSPKSQRSNTQIKMRKKAKALSKLNTVKNLDF